MAIVFYDLHLNHLDKKLTDANFTQSQFHAQDHGDIQ